MKFQWMVGFSGLQIPAWFEQGVQAGWIGGWLIFDDVNRYHFEGQALNPGQLAHWIREVKSLKPGLKVFVDQEGGPVSRLKARRGFVQWPASRQFQKWPLEWVEKTLNKAFQQWAQLGIDGVLAPVVDLDYPHNQGDISRWGRAWHGDPQAVIQWGQLWLNLGRKYGIQVCLKHYPGLGHVVWDTHESVATIRVDPLGLRVFEALLPEAQGHMVMLAHVWDPIWAGPEVVSLNPQVIRRIRTLCPHVSVVVDDVQMQGLRGLYSYPEIFDRLRNLDVNWVIAGNVLDPGHHWYQRWLQWSRPT